MSSPAFSLRECARSTQAFQTSGHSLVLANNVSVGILQQGLLCCYRKSASCQQVSQQVDICDTSVCWCMSSMDASQCTSGRAQLHTLYKSRSSSMLRQLISPFIC